MSRFLNIHHALILGNPPFGEEYGSCAREVVHQVVIMKSVDQVKSIVLSSGIYTDHQVFIMKLVDQVKSIILSSGIYTDRPEWHTLHIV